MVIQRWQSLLLLVAAAVMCCFSFCSLGQVQTTDYTFNFTSLGFYQEGIPTDGVANSVSHTWYFFVFSLTTALLLLIDIFLFKNLPLQKKVCLVGVLFIVVSAAAGIGLAYTFADGAPVGWSAVAACPLIALVAAIMAWTCMQRDHNKLKAVDRIR